MILSPWDTYIQTNSQCITLWMERKYKPTFFCITLLNPVSRDFSSCCRSSIFSPWSSSPLICLFYFCTFIAIFSLHITSQPCNKWPNYTSADGFFLQSPCPIWSNCCSLRATMQNFLSSVTKQTNERKKSHI